jgi:hypothetical protein
MKDLIKLRFTFGLAVAGVAATLSGQANAAGKILLTGTDGWELHGDGDYGQQVVNYLGGKVALINDFGVLGATTLDGVSVTGFSSLPADLTGFTGIEFASPGSCCGDPAFDTTLGIQTGVAQIQAFLAAGGNISIENFSGLSDWAPILGFDPGPGMIYGVGGVGCSDPGISTVAGAAAGFNRGVYVEGCFIHQLMDTSFFAAHGYVAFVDGFSAGSGQSVLMGSGVPEPASWAMMVGGFGLIGGAVRARRKVAVTFA